MVCGQVISWLLQWLWLAEKQSAHEATEVQAQVLQVEARLRASARAQAFKESQGLLSLAYCSLCEKHTEPNLYQAIWLAALWPYAAQRLEMTSNGSLEVPLP